MEVYLVGGAVRDRLLGRPVHERDWVVVGARPEELERDGFVPVGREFPVFLHPKTHEEYALARLERKVGLGYRGFTTQFAPDVTLDEDLKRRDLTINAMAETESGEIIDPYGGRRDLEARLLRHVSDAFVEDPVRILRVARFAARYADLGFRVAEETLALMRRMTESGEVDALVPDIEGPALGRFRCVRHDAQDLVPQFATVPWPSSMVRAALKLGRVILVLKGVSTIGVKVICLSDTLINGATSGPLGSPA